MPEVLSTAIDRIDYDDAAATLYITFRSSGTYGFKGVPRFLYDAFLLAPSKGRFFARHIRGRYVQGERLRWAIRSSRDLVARSEAEDETGSLDHSAARVEDQARDRDSAEAA